MRTMTYYDPADYTRRPAALTRRRSGLERRAPSTSYRRKYHGLRHINPAAWATSSSATQIDAVGDQETGYATFLRARRGWRSRAGADPGDHRQLHQRAFCARQDAGRRGLTLPAAGNDGAGDVGPIQASRSATRDRRPASGRSRGRRSTPNNSARRSAALRDRGRRRRTPTRRSVATLAKNVGTSRRADARRQRRRQRQ